MDIRQKNYIIPRVQPTELEGYLAEKSPSEDASIPLGREKKAEGGRDLGGKGKKGNTIRYGGGDRIEA